MAVKFKLVGGNRRVEVDGKPLGFIDQRGFITDPSIMKKGMVRVTPEDMQELALLIEAYTRSARRKALAKPLENAPAIDCEFRQLDTHEWYCIEHDCTMLGAEPVSCLIQRSTL